MLLNRAAVTAGSLGGAGRLAAASIACRQGIHFSPRQPRIFGSRPRPCLPTLLQQCLQTQCYSQRTGQEGKESQHDDSSRPGTATTASKTKDLLKRTRHEDIYTLPNLLTFSRLVASPFVGYLILQDNHAWALGLLAYSAVTDVLDGWIARRWNKKTVVGTVIDPMADKALMAILTVALAVKGALPLWLATIILGRDAGLGVAAIYFRWISLPPPKSFVRYWDFSLPSAEVHPTTISKYNTFLQLALIGLTTAAPVVPMDLSTPLTVMQYVVALTTVWSGASYIYTKDAVKILNKTKRPSKPQ